MIKRYFVFILMPIFLSNSVSQAQEISERLEKQKHEVFVILKLIDVQVTDKKGDIVKDLNREDFIIFDNKKIVPITYFEKKDIEVISTKEQLSEDKLSARVEGETRRKFFLIFDFFNTSGRGIYRAKEAALHFIDSQVRSTDLLSVIFISLTKGLIIKEFMTQNHSQVKKTIEKINLQEIAGSSSRSDEIEEGLIPFEEYLIPREKVLDWTRFQENIKRKEIQTFTNLMTTLAKSLRIVPFTKHLVFFSVGPNSDFIYRIGEFKEDYESMIKEFASSSCIIYSVNVQGIINPLLDWTAKGEQALLRLSQITGGKYYPNTEDFRPAMEDIAKRTSFYYVLGIPVKEEMDGKFHKIEVKVKRKGVKVHAPSGYYNPKPFKEYSEFEKLLHLVDCALSQRPLLQEVKEFSFHLNPVEREKNLFEILFEVSEGEVLKGGDLEVVIIFFDSKKEILKMKREEVKEVKDSGVFSYRRIVMIPPETDELRVVVRNLSSGRTMRGIGKVK